MVVVALLPATEDVPLLFLPFSRSEPLTFEKEDWLEIPNQTMIVITPNVSGAPVVNKSGTEDALVVLDEPASGADRGRVLARHSRKPRKVGRVW